MTDLRDAFNQQTHQAIYDAAHKDIAPVDYEQSKDTKNVWGGKIVEEIKGYLSNSQGIELLLRDEYFMGFGDRIYPAVLDDILDLFEERRKRPINLATFVEGIGSGKSEKASAILWLLWLELCCEGGNNPQKYYDLTDGSVIAFSIMSRTEALAKKVAFQKIYKRFRTPFNRAYFPPSTRYEQEVVINRNNTVFFPGTGSALSAIGYDLYSGWIDEANFLEVIIDSKKASISTRYDAAEEMYNAIMDRMVSRFMKEGKLPGILIMTSSPRYPSDFMERVIKDNERLAEKAAFFTRRRNLWVAKGAKFFPSNEYFYVDTNTLKEIERSKGEALLELRDLIINMKRDCYNITHDYTTSVIPFVLKVPIELYQRYIANPTNFVRNIGCVPLEAIKPFFRRRKALETVISLDRPNPLIEAMPYKFLPDYKVINPDASRFLHLDLAYSQDALGIACVHCTGFEERMKTEGIRVRTVMAPKIHVDWLARLTAPQGDELDLDEAIQIMFRYRAIYGIRIKLVTFDRFQSIGFIQGLRKQGLVSAVLSIDRTAKKIVLDNDPKNIKRYKEETTGGNYIAAMQCLKDAIYQDRIDIPNHPYYLIEARGAEHNEIKNKVDHIPTGSLDLLQALAGAVFNLDNNTQYVNKKNLNKNIQQAGDNFYRNHRQLATNESRHLAVHLKSKIGDPFYKKDRDYG